MLSLIYGRSSVIKQDIVNRVAEQLNITKVKAEIAVESVFNSLKNALKRGERIELRGFGVFIVKPRKSGVGRNPRTEKSIPPGKTEIQARKEFAKKSAWNCRITASHQQKVLHVVSSNLPQSD
jgi:DNA-binding protein HU-beta